VEHLARCVGRLVRRGNAVVVIEHHTELLEVCDRLVELGPEGGEAGGQIIATGTPADLAADAGSITGRWLSLGGASPGAGRRPAPEAPARGNRAKAPRRAKKAAARKTQGKGGASKGKAKAAGGRVDTAVEKRRQAR